MKIYKYRNNDNSRVRIFTWKPIRCHILNKHVSKREKFFNNLAQN